MAKSINIPITNGSGTASVADSDYSVTANVAGYDNSTVTPPTVKVEAGITVYSFTISATGTLTLHVTEDGTASGTPVAGAIFYRCDSLGTTYGDAIETDSQGEAVFENVPYVSGTGYKLYYKQTASDVSHSFDSSLKNTTLTEKNTTIEIANPAATVREFELKDANYDNIPIETGTLILTEE